MTEYSAYHYADGADPEHPLCGAKGWGIRTTNSVSDVECEKCIAILNKDKNEVILEWQ